MKKIGFILTVLFLCPCVSMAQTDDDFDSFMNSELKSFDDFIDEANKQFISFLRNPWKEFKSEQPVEKRIEPEPVKPVEYDEKTSPKDEKPVCLTIEEILDLTSNEGKQKPVVKINDVEDITFDEPEVVAKKQNKPVVVKEKPKDKPVPSVGEKTKDEPVTKPVEAPARPVVTPVKPVERPVAKPSVTPTKPAVKPAPSTPLHVGGEGRSRITYLGMTYYMSDGLKGRCSLSGLKENDIADAYERLCKSDYKTLLSDLRQVISELRLNDWGLYLLVEAVTKSFCANNNDAVVMQQFLFNELGYKAKMARKAGANQMLLFVATDCSVYAHPFFVKDGQKFYCMSQSDPCQFYMCQQDAAKARKQMGMVLKSAPNLSGKITSSTHTNDSKDVTVTLGVPNLLMEFYKLYPQCDYRVYFTAPVNSEVKTPLLESLRPCIQGKGEAEAANILINFVQTGFEYATDGQQFGYEKPFFVEELFYYPYCDCEDRSILYSFLVRELLGLDVVLLDYPDHIATAVRFNESVNGDFVMVGGQKYVVCDPTYIGAPIGVTMPQYKKVSANVLKY